MTTICTLTTASWIWFGLGGFTINHENIIVSSENACYAYAKLHDAAAYSMSYANGNSELERRCGPQLRDCRVVK